LILAFTLTGNPGNDFLYCIFGVGLIEEFIKFLPVLLILLIPGSVKEPVDYLIFASISALGFAFSENMIYLDEQHVNLIQGRGLTATVSHMFDTSLIAYGIILARYRKKGFPVLNYFLFLLLAAFTHGFYDFWLLNKQVSVFNLLSFGFMLGSLIAWVTFINNALNISPFFTYSRSFNGTYLKKYLISAVIFIVLLEYFVNGMFHGAEEANLELSLSLFSVVFFTLFYATNFSYLDLVKNYWSGITISRFVWKVWYNKMIGEEVIITAMKSSFEGVFPIKGKITGREVIGKDSAHYSFHPATPVVIKGKVFNYLILKLLNVYFFQKLETKAILVLVSDLPEGVVKEKSKAKLLSRAFITITDEKTEILNITV
jgi:hypothetical protein